MIEEICKCGKQLNDKENHTLNTIKNEKGEEALVCNDCFEREVDRACKVYKHLIGE